MAFGRPNYLLEEIRQRVARSPVVFDWYAQIAEQGDRIDDPSVHPGIDPADPMLTLRNDAYPNLAQEAAVRIRPTHPASGEKEKPMTRSGRNVEEEATFKSAGDLTIAYRSWRTTGLARGLVVIVPGFNSHSGYYGWVAEQLIELGLSVYAVDLRGRGRSDGERFYVAQFDDYLADVAGMVHLATGREPNLPVFILGHSAGGVLACLYALEHQSALAGLVCESFAFQTPAPDFALAVLKGLGHVFPHAHVLHLKNEDFSRDPSVVAAMNADPLIAHETQPTQTVAELVRADERLRSEFPRITLPVLILHGTADKAAKSSGSQLFFEAAGSTDKTLKLYEGHAHDLLNDLDKKAVMEDIEHWISARLPAAPKEATR